MTDNPNTGSNANQDLGLAPAEPAAPAMSIAEAVSRKNELINDAEFRNLLMAGDVGATAEWKRVVNAISAPPPASTGPGEAAAEHLNASASYTLSPEVMQEFRSNAPVSPIERHFAQAKFEEFKNDLSWIARLNRGELQAKKELALVQSILSRPVRDTQQS